MEIRGFGSVVQLDKRKTRYKCRKWILQVNTSNGRKQKRFTGSLSEAKKALDVYIEHLENDKLETNIKFEDFSKYWLKMRKASNSFSSNTLASNEKNIRALNRLFGKKKLYEITSKDIREKIYFLVSEKTGKPVTNQHKAKLLVNLNQIFNFAVSDKVVSSNPCKDVEKPKKEIPEKKALSTQDFQKAIQSLKKERLDGRVVAVLTILYLGLRRSEVCALKWEDYNKKDKTLTIQRAWKDGDCKVGETKSHAGKRTLPMPDDLCQIFDEWKNIWNLCPHSENYICINYYGDILRGYVLWKFWKNYTEKHNLPYVTLHELRHTNLTIVARYMSPFDLQHYAGWSDLGPARIYIHKDQSAMRNAINQIDFSE